MMTIAAFLPPYTVCVILLMLVVFGLLMALFSPGLDQPAKRFFRIFFLMLFLCIGSHLTLQAAEFMRAGAGLVWTAVFLQSLFSGLLLPPFSHYLFFCIGKKKKSLFCIVCALCALYTVFLLTTLFTRCFFYITPEGAYYRGDWYPLLLAPPAAVLLIDLAVLLKNRGSLPGKQFAAFLLCVFAPFAAALVQMRVSGFPLVTYSLAVASAFLFLFVFAEQAENNKRRQEELLRQRVSLSVLRMRPHFIYNTMTSIYHLIGQDAETARQVTLDFTDYLRRNFSAIAEDAPVPFPEELAHTRAYLAVEQVRFQDYLFVTFDTPFVDFQLPPLTLQPLVENAVKHGVSPEREPLRITVTTRDAGDRCEVTVEDTGPGFAGTEQDDRYGTLTNIRERLRIMCGGSLSVLPREGGGTSAVVTVPLNRGDKAADRPRRRTENDKTVTEKSP